VGIKLYIINNLPVVTMYVTCDASNGNICSTEKSDTMTKSRNVAGLPGKSCWAARLFLTGLWSAGFWRSSGTGLYHVIKNDYL